MITEIEGSLCPSITVFLKIYPEKKMTTIAQKV
jgi:hypothetical protein